MDHIHRIMDEVVVFSVTLTHHNHPDRTYQVRVTNEETRTYFSDPGWNRLLILYDTMQEGREFKFLLSHTYGIIYFTCFPPDSSDEDEDE